MNLVASNLLSSVAFCQQAGKLGQQKIWRNQVRLARLVLFQQLKSRTAIGLW